MPRRSSPTVITDKNTGTSSVVIRLKKSLTPELARAPFRLSLITLVSIKYTTGLFVFLAVEVLVATDIRHRSKHLTERFASGTGKRRFQNRAVLGFGAS